jgi:hypothetical protein
LRNQAVRAFLAKILLADFPVDGIQIEGLVKGTKTLKTRFDQYFGILKQI